ncbi:glycerophosphodiester phosphodiesterase [Pseudomonas gingeri]|uniref:glycerophosphodiester phosphodiesterase family protein n=1 Tax=Pseudomonas gingeri TaxID=117681 RepID=UPI0015A2F78D|nr:glycerophosphodiester phosphodiesterase family protein [Pseudomonas gingeri]NWA25391.1 glycerophosphodiester phosphodiesterase [Pseudomonas gingeri]NWD68804.1 glycerophosphodiester phosphodiesterase [Pseudomonas gingeri]
MHTRPGLLPVKKSLVRFIVLGCSLLVGACDSTSKSLPGAGPTASTPFKTLDGAQPLIIGHRGLPGLYPEETRASYENAADAGADSLEMDLHMTKDCVLVARHNPWLSDNTNIGEVAKINAEVARRKRTVPGVLVNVKYPATAENGPAQYLSDLTDPNDPKSVLKSLVVDGEDHTNDWSISDFTLAELKQWIGGTTYDARDQRPTELNGKLPILSFQEVIDIAKAKSAATGRVITTYPESKNPIWNNAQAVANGCGAPGSHPFEKAFLKVLNDNDLNRKDAPVFVQSFDPGSLKYLRSIGLKSKAVQLVDGNGVNFKTGETIFITDKPNTFVSGRPYSWTVAGDPRPFGAMLTPAGLAEVKTYADGIGPWKPQAMSLTVAAAQDSSSASLDKVDTLKPTALISDAHKANLFVHIFTFRNEAKYLAGAYKGDPAAEYLAFYRAGVDGVFTDFTPNALAARNLYLKEVAR